MPTVRFPLRVCPKSQFISPCNWVSGIISITSPTTFQITCFPRADIPRVANVSIGSNYIMLDRGVRKPTHPNDCLMSNLIASFSMMPRTCNGMLKHDANLSIYFTRRQMGCNLRSRSITSRVLGNHVRATQHVQKQAFSEV